MTEEPLPTKLLGDLFGLESPAWHERHPLLGTIPEVATLELGAVKGGRSVRADGGIRPNYQACSIGGTENTGLLLETYAMRSEGVRISVRFDVVRSEGSSFIGNPWTQNASQRLALRDHSVDPQRRG